MPNPKEGDLLRGSPENQAPGKNTQMEDTRVYHTCQAPNMSKRHPDTEARKGEKEEEG